MNPKIVVYDGQALTCDRFDIPAREVAPGDYIFDEYDGVSCVTQVVERAQIVELYDERGRAHLYNGRAVIGVYREREDGVEE